MQYPIDRIVHATVFVNPVAEHWMEREIAQWVHNEESTWVSNFSFQTPTVDTWGLHSNIKAKCSDLYYKGI